MAKTVNMQVVRNIATHTANWTFEHLVAMGVDQETAKELSRDAGDAAGNSVLRDLQTHGYTVEK